MSKSTANTLSTAAIVLREELAAGTMKRLGSFSMRGLEIELRQGMDSVWILVRRPGLGGIALRTGFALAGLQNVRWTPATGDMVHGRITFEAAVGAFLVEVWHDGLERPVLRATTKLTPRQDTLITHLPRDLYLLDANDNPGAVEGHVEAAQRGLNVGLVYLRFDEPSFGDLLYVQNLTALNPYFQATKTKPDAAVGGEWPELGYLPPTPPQAATPPMNPLPGGQEVTLSDAILVFGEDGSNVERHSALKFMQMLAAAYPLLGKPEPKLRDWVGRARKTLRDLETAPEATLTYERARYVHPYLAAEYPDSMSQLSVLAALRDWEIWSGETFPFSKSMRKGVEKFYDPQLGTLRRYLPNVGKDKNADAVDSWYLYHPLLKLGRLAKEDEAAKTLFANCLQFGIKAARHFKYAWPIQFDITSFKVIQAARNDDGLGQTDVGGLYAYVMLQAFELLGDAGYLEEAKAALTASREMRFELEYQANLTAWGATACLKLYRVTEHRQWLGHSYVFLASLLHNSVIWESEIEGAAEYQTFLGATCLHDAPYLAAYECYDSFCALEEYLKLSGPELDDSARLMASEYCRYALSRAWFFYPDTLSPDRVAKQFRNGRVDRELSFPVEDLYADGQPAGQVGQEIYGSGAAPSFAVRAFHRLPDAPFLLFSDQFVAIREVVGPGAFALSLTGPAAGEARVIVLRQPRHILPQLLLSTNEGEVRPQSSDKDQIVYAVPADARLVVQWRPGERRKAS